MGVSEQLAWMVRKVFRVNPEIDVRQAIRSIWVSI